MCRHKAANGSKNASPLPRTQLLIFFWSASRLASRAHITCASYSHRKIAPESESDSPLLSSLLLCHWFMPSPKPGLADPTRIPIIPKPGPSSPLAPSPQPRTPPPKSAASRSPPNFSNPMAPVLLPPVSSHDEIPPAPAASPRALALAAACAPLPAAPVKPPCSLPPTKRLYPASVFLAPSHASPPTSVASLLLPKRPSKPWRPPSSGLWCSRVRLPRRM